MKKLIPILVGKPFNVESVKAWAQEMAQAGLSFHYEDDPAEIEKGDTGELLFTKQEAKLVEFQVRHAQRICNKASIDLMEIALEAKKEGA